MPGQPSFSASTTPLDRTAATAASTVVRCGPTPPGNWSRTCPMSLATTRGDAVGGEVVDQLAASERR